MTDNNKWSEWIDKRNVLDKYKGMDTEEIKSDVKNNTYPFAVLMMNLQGDFNLGSVVRSANSLGASEVFYYGKKKFDRRATTGTYHYTDVCHLSSFEDVVSLKEKYSFVALENNIERNIVQLNKFNWKTHRRPLIILGEEGAGLENDILDLCEHFVEIPSRGSVRSINAACAASIAMYDYVSKLQGE